MTTTTATLGQLIDRHGVEVLDHLDRQAEIPVFGSLQFQGDLAIIPSATIAAEAEALAGGTWTEVPAAGIAVIEAIAGGHEHRLLPGAPATALWQPAAGGGQDIGLLAVPAGAPAYLAHPEHGYVGIGTGTYVLRRQREQADEERLVAD